MTISQQDVDDIDATLVKTAKRGARGVSSGDKRVDFLDPDKLREIAGAAAEQVNGGIYSLAPSPKGYY
jgi:hypothetical protein